MAGYIKLHRQLLDSPYFLNEKHLKIWIWILLKANHKKTTVNFKTGKKILEVELDRGQFIFGRKSAAEALDLDESLIYRVINKFEKDNSISIKSDTNYSIITVCKYDTYNKIILEDEQVSNKYRTSIEQVSNTDKNDKKKEEGKRTKIYVPPSIELVKQYFAENGYSEVSAEKAFNYYNVADWFDSTGKQVKNWKQKMLMVWFKEENKISTTSIQQSEFDEENYYATMGQHLRPKEL